MDQFFLSPTARVILVFPLLLLAVACGSHDKFDVAEARRNVEDYSISSVSFRSMDRFFDIEWVEPGTPKAASLGMELAPLDISVELGGDKLNLQKALDYTDTNALLVMRDGKVVYEEYRNGSDAESRFVSWSMAKSITSILFGVALSEKKIQSIDDAIDVYLPELKGTVFEGVSLKNMLLQRAGTDYKEWTFFGSADVDELVEQSLFTGETRFTNFADLQLKRTGTTGESFNYSTLNSTLLGRVIEVATGKSLAEYTEEKLWIPAGMQDSAFWMLDGKAGEGKAFAGGGFNATLRDYARIGQMMLQEGFINGQQVVPKDWVLESTQYNSDEAVIKGAPRGYQYQWWTFLGTNIFEAVGIHGQTISIDPDTNSVIVKLSYWPKRGGGSFARENHAVLTAIRQSLSAQ